MKENKDIGGVARNEFAKLFKVQYDKAIVSENIEKDVDYNKYVEALLKEGTFNHTIDTPIASFISDLLDVTIVKPIIEAIIGEDLITHDDLSGIERCFKAGMAVIDIVTLGQAGLFEGGLKAGGKNLLKTIGVEFLSNGAALTVNKAGEMLNLPAPIVLLLSLGAGYTVSRIGTKNIVKNAEGKVVYEAEEIIKTKAPLSQRELKGIISIPKGSRPAVSTYLDEKYIAKHLQRFEDGGSFVMTRDQYNQFVRGKDFIGCPDNTQFIAPKEYMDKIALKANGDISVFEKMLGFDPEHFSKGHGLVRIDIKDPYSLNLRIPTGNEMGANSHWIPGGYTDGGTAEAIVDCIPNNNSNVNITFLD